MRGHAPALALQEPGHKERAVGQIGIYGGVILVSEAESVVHEWLNSLRNLNVEVKKMFGCYCLYCDGQAVGWIHDSVMSLREVGLTYLPKDIKRPSKEDKIQELVIPLDYANADWLAKAVQDTATIRKANS